VTLKTLTDAKANAKAAAASRYMFTGRTGQPLRPDNVTSRFNQLALGARVRPIGPHQIRHLLASSLLDAGYGIHEVAERLGHDPAPSCATTPASTPRGAAKPPNTSQD
jgi:integrase